VPHGPLLQPAVLAKVLGLLGDTSRPDLSAAAACTLAHCCNTEEEVRLFLSSTVFLSCLSLIIFLVYSR